MTSSTIWRLQHTVVGNRCDVPTCFQSEVQRNENLQRSTAAGDKWPELVFKMETLIHRFGPDPPYVLLPFVPHLIFRTIFSPHCSVLVSPQEIRLLAGDQRNTERARVSFLMKIN